MKIWHNIKMVLTLSCDRASALLSKSQDTPLTRWERVALRLHLWICRFCRRYRHQLQLMRQLFQAVAQKSRAGAFTYPKLFEEQRSRIIKNLEEQL